MDIIVIIAAIEKITPVILEVADALHLNNLAADLVRKVAASLVADAKKTATPIDDAVASVVSTVLDHVAVLLEQGAVQDALSLLKAFGKFAGAK